MKIDAMFFQITISVSIFHSYSKNIKTDNKMISKHLYK